MNQKIYIVTPCFNDFESLYILLSNIDDYLDSQNMFQISVVIVNDGSTIINHQSSIINHQFRHIDQIIQIDLIRNVGHQRAIAIGLAYINDFDQNFDSVVLMDCDGEDDYRDVFRIIREMSDETIVFAKRRKRSESLSFRVFYFFYKLFFKFLTGNSIHGGNFSSIPRKLLVQVVHLGEIWNNYHSGILKSKLKIKYIECDRAKRYKGQSKMNFTSLIIHGLSAISVFNENVFVRLTIFSATLFGMSFFAILIVLIFKFVLNIASPGWATSVIGIILVLCTQFLFMFLNFTFINLGSRNKIDFLPVHDYKNFILRVENIKPNYQVI